MENNPIDTLTHEQIFALMPEMRGCEIEVSELKGGITNKLYRVRDGRSGDYVFRLYGKRTEMFIDREMEMKTMKLLEKIGIVPKLIKYLPEDCITVIEYIDAYTLKNPDFLNEQLWEKIVRPVRLIHKSGVSISKIFDPLIETKRLEKILFDITTRYTEFDINGTVKILERINERANISHTEYVICHNDLLAENFMLVKDETRSGEPMYLIDWEYAGMNTFYYEFADMFQEILVGRNIERKLIEIYWENANIEYNVYMTEMFKPFPDIYWFLWSLIQLNVSTIQFDYYNYGKVKYENAQQNIKYLRENYSLKI